MQENPRRLMAACTLLMTLLLPLAAPVVAQAATVPSIPISELSSTVHEQPDGSVVLIVAAELPANAKLPATVSLPIPKNAKVDWAGEILGGDPSADPTLKYTIEKGTTYDLAVMTVTKGHEAQVEMSDLGAVTINGDRHTVEATLPVPYAVGEARIALRVPPGGQLLDSVPKSAPQPGPENYTYYPVSRTSPKAGTVLTAKISYAGGSAPAAGGASAGGSAAGTSGGSSSATVGLLVVAGIVVAVALVAVVRLARKTPPGEEGPDGDEGPVDSDEDAHGDEEDPEGSGDAGDDVFGEENLEVEHPLPTTKAVKAKAAGKAPGGSVASKTVGAKAGTKPSPKASKAPPSRPGLSLPMILAAVVVVGVIAFAVFGASRTSVVEGGRQSVEGGVQRITVDTRGGQFKPGDFKAKAGMPIELVFGAGTACTSRITFKELDIDQDLRSGATVKIPPLKAGTYPYLCGSGSPSGSLIVE